MNKNKCLLLALGFALVAGQLQAAMSITTQPDQPLVFCGSCDANDTTAIAIDVPGAKDGELVSLDVKHDGGLVFASGFPFMEGAPLLKGNYVVRGGKVQVKTHFPIRGSYTVNAGHGTETLKKELCVVEPGHVKGMVIKLIGAMAAIGLIAGMIFGRSAAAAMFMLVFLGVSSGMLAHGDEVHPVESQRSMIVDGWQADLTFAPDPPPVGELGHLSLKVKNVKTGKPLGAATARVTIDLLEYELIIFDGEIMAPNGVFDLSYGYFDGSDHQVNFEISPADKSVKPFKVSFGNEVGGKAPPAAMKLGTVFFLMLVMLAGFIVGFKLKSGKTA